jgi:hypothetical protein
MRLSSSSVPFCSCCFSARTATPWCLLHFVCLKAVNGRLFLAVSSMCALLQLLLLPGMFLDTAVVVGSVIAGKRAELCNNITADVQQLLHVFAVFPKTASESCWAAYLGCPTRPCCRMRWAASLACKLGSMTVPMAVMAPQMTVAACRYVHLPVPGSRSLRQKHFLRGRQISACGLRCRNAVLRRRPAVITTCSSTAASKVAVGRYHWNT